MGLWPRTAPVRGWPTRNVYAIIGRVMVTLPLGTVKHEVAANERESGD